MDEPHPVRIAYLGPVGTFTEEALIEFMGTRNYNGLPRPTIEDVLCDVAAGNCDYGFVPIENSIEGTVTPALDALIFRFRLHIYAEFILPVRQQLIATKGAKLEDIGAVYSYAHALAQVGRFLRDQLPKAELHHTDSTAEAVRIVADTKTKSIAAIGPRRAAELYGLDVLIADIDDHAANSTRFLLLNNDTIPQPTGHDKTSIVCFQVEDRPGSLLSILAEIASRGISLTKLESRPTKTGIGIYCFAIDFEGHIADQSVQEVISDLNRYLGHVKFLGSYPTFNDRHARPEPQPTPDPLISELLGQIEATPTH
ncbi:prephenate dehydratase [Ferrimicrobium sp.]|uniref:prephenate dehydratase n=1 Tax=Ferrimicrobium sp. TaxID=2926050 RepID=UPI002636FD18|nr:prephenate dehydratase [Ferrimicrobium sp.]